MCFDCSISRVTATDTTFHQRSGNLFGFSISFPHGCRERRDGREGGRGAARARWVTRSPPRQTRSRRNESHPKSAETHFARAGQNMLPWRCWNEPHSRRAKGWISHYLPYVTSNDLRFHAWTTATKRPRNTMISCGCGSQAVAMTIDRRLSFRITPRSHSTRLRSSSRPLSIRQCRLRFERSFQRGACCTAGSFLDATRRRLIGRTEAGALRSARR